MKLKLLFFTLIGSVAIAHAQYTVTDINGDELNNGDILEFGVQGYGTDANYEFFVTNDNPSETIYTRIEFVSAVNATGEQFELCYADNCYTPLTVGGTYPPASDTYAIAVGATTGEGNHFLNANPGNGTDILEYVFAFHQYETDGVTEIGAPLIFTYRYDPNLLGVNDNSKVNLSIQSTVVSSELVLIVNEPVTMMIYDLQGRIIKQARFEAGRQSINVSNLSSQAYILQFQNERGAMKTTKIVVQ